jgi:hypothetical protein
MFTFRGTRIVQGGSAHEPEVHVKMPPAIRCPYRQMSSGLLANPSLFLKVDEPKGVVFKNQGQASNIARKDIELVNTRGTQTKEPDFQFHLFRFGS